MILIGGGGHCKVVIDILNTLGIIPYGIFDDDNKSHGKEIMGIPVLGKIDELRDYTEKVEYAVITITDPTTHLLLSKKCYEMSLKLGGFSHPSATISSFASISSKAQICSGCVINPSSFIKDHITFF